jgi:hypothetical protein
MPVNYGKELCLAFGDYVESYEGTTNTSKARSSACIALYPTANSTGAWVLWKIESRTRVGRTNYVKLVTNELIINAMNQIALSEEHEASQPEARVIAESQQEAQEESQQEAQEEPQQSIDNEGVAEPEIGVEGTVEAVDETVRTRSGRAVVKPSRFAAVTKVSHDQWRTEENLKAINLELKMLFEDLRALRVVRRASIKAGTKILRSHMFVVEKYLADGRFDKMKARLVADGRDQESSLYPDKASPTVAIHSVFAVLGVMASKKSLTVAKIDVKGAFVQTPMEGESVYMRLDQKISAYVVELYPTMK